jgi:hypothetical protein
MLPFVAAASEPRVTTARMKQDEAVWQSFVDTNIWWLCLT